MRPAEALSSDLSVAFTNTIVTLSDEQRNSKQFHEFNRVHSIKQEAHASPPKLINNYHRLQRVVSGKLLVVVVTTVRLEGYRSQD